VRRAEYFLGLQTKWGPENTECTCEPRYWGCHSTPLGKMKLAEPRPEWLTMDNRAQHLQWRNVMAESVYKIIELVGTSAESWEKAAAAAVNTASQSLRDLRVAEIIQLDMHLEEGKILAYRARVRVSFKFERE
jgi:dodecin